MIPVLSLPGLSGDDLVEALEESSCVFVVDHGFALEALDALLTTSREFFAQDESAKARVQWSGDLPWRGWQPVHSTGSGRMLLERFEISFTPGGPEGDAPADRALERWAATFEQWPDDPERFRPAWTDAYAQLRDVASTVTRLLAEGLGVPGRDLPAWTVGQHANLVVHHYLAQHEAPAAGELRYQPHTDIGGVTLLWADDAPGGLEAQLGPDGEWVPVTHPPGALLVQAGDLLHLWSRGRIPANLHRVVNPPPVPGVAPSARYSVAYFHHPDLDTWIAPSEGDDVPGSAPAGPSSAGVGAREHVLERQRQLGRAQQPRSS